MRRIIPAVLLLCLAGASALRAEPAVAPEELPVACSLPTEALSKKVTEALSRKSSSVADIARAARRCSCEQATSMAQQLVRALKALQQENREAAEPIFSALTQSCSSCGADPAVDPKNPELAQRCACRNDANVGERCDVEQRLQQADALKVRPPRSEDCFCAAAASLAAQAFAGEAQRFGFFPDEGAFSGGGVGPGVGALSSTQSVTNN